MSESGKKATFRQKSYGKTSVGEELLQRYLDRIAEDTEFKEWYFGHWHKDEVVDNFICLYNDVVELYMT